MSETLASPSAETVLHRRDATRRMARFYHLAVQMALPLAEHAPGCDMIREWGRIGSAGMVRVDPHPDVATATRAALKLETLKRRKGYR